MVHNLVYGNPDIRDVGFCGKTKSSVAVCTSLMKQIQLFVLRVACCVSRKNGTRFKSRVSGAVGMAVHEVQPPCPPLEGGILW